MLHPLFSTILRRPDLVSDHVVAYAALIRDEATGAGTDLLQRGVAWAVTALGALVFLILLGVAVMLGVLLNQFHWILVAVPAGVLLLTVLAFARARTALPSKRFQELKAQLESDARALRTVS